jgi:hypothetical protein
MSDDLVERLREEQPVTQDMESTFKCALQDEAADRIEELEAKLAKAVEGLEELARLGNGDRYGNSYGNMIAREYLAELTGGKNQ